MTTTQAPSRDELVSRAAGIVPLLRDKAVWMDENRRLHEDVIAALTQAGILKMRVPARYGGFQADMRTVADVIAELGRGDGSVSWTVAVWAISTWVMCGFPDEVQDRVFATPDVRISGILSPSAVAVPVDGGFLLNGKWSFNTGAQQSTWNTNAAVLATPEGGYAPIMTAIPIADLKIVDDWHTSGLRASGSVTTIAKDVFLHSDQVLPFGEMRSKYNISSPVYTAPFMPVACGTVSATAHGMAMAAKDAFLERLPGRKITYTSYENQSEAPLTHLQLADATTRIKEAAYHAHQCAEMVDTMTGREWSMEERARARLHLGGACQRAREAVDILDGASGGSSVYRDVPIQRIQRDVQTLCLHAILHPDTNLELYGRVQLGLEPNTIYI